MSSVRMSTTSRSSSPSVVTETDSSGAPTARATTTGVASARWLRSTSTARVELLAPRPGRRVVEREDEVGRAGRIEAPLDDLPRLELVRQRDHAEVVAQRRADPGRGGLHRREARHDPHLDVRQRDIAVDDLQHGGGHREDARVARRHDRHARAAGRQLEGVAGALAPRRGCRSRGGAARAARARARGRSRSRSAHRRPPARRAPRASASPGRRARARRRSRARGGRCAARARSSAPAPVTCRAPGRRPRPAARCARRRCWRAPRRSPARSRPPVGPRRRRRGTCARA